MADHEKGKDSRGDGLLEWLKLLLEALKVLGPKLALAAAAWRAVARFTGQPRGRTAAIGVVVLLALLLILLPEEVSGVKVLLATLIVAVLCIMLVVSARRRETTGPESPLDRYCHALLPACNRLQLTTIDIKAATTPEAVDLELAEVFTSLDVLGAGRREAAEDEEPERLEAAGQERMSAMAAVSQWKQLVLLGDAGSGKSTLTNFITLCLAGDWVGHGRINRSRLGEGCALPRLLPVRVVLREYVAEGLLSGMGIWDFIKKQLSSGILAALDLSPTAQAMGEQLLKRDGGLVILDGLDEVPEANETREKLKAEVEEFRREFPNCRMLVTTRPYAYQSDAWRLPGFEVKWLAEFSDEQIATFIEKWYAHIAVKDASLSEADAARYTDQLKAAVEGNERVRELAPRPLLLTLMASLHRWRGGALPEKRQQLYEAAVALLLELWQRPKARFDADGKLAGAEYDVFRELHISQDALRKALNRVAYEAHRHQTDLERTADIPVGKIAEALYEASEQKEDVSIEEVTRYVTERAGLLIEREPGKQYAFPHRTFQEYLAACHLTELDFPFELVERVREDDERWREVVLLAASKAVSGVPSSIWTLVGELCPNNCTLRPKPSDDDWYAALRAAQALIETDQHKGVSDRVRTRFDRLRTWLEKLCTTGALPPTDRAEAGRALANLGDQRPGVGVHEDGTPDVLWCSVPGGTLQMGEGEEAHSVGVAPFQLAVYPVTNAQFRPFVQDDGYREREYWPQAGWEWREENKRAEPGYWQDKEWNLPSHPVVGVTWYEAVAYSRWLTRRLRETDGITADEEVRLPTEAEWEWAARGHEGNRYPWGDDWADGRCNSYESGIIHTCAVGLFPADTARWLPDKTPRPQDMAGNALEWCSSKHEPYPYRADDGREAIEDPGSVRVLRGGSWYNNARLCRSANRTNYRPTYTFLLRWCSFVCFRQGSELVLCSFSLLPPFPSSPLGELGANFRGNEVL